MHPLRDIKRKRRGSAHTERTVSVPGTVRWGVVCTLLAVAAACSSNDPAERLERAALQVAEGEYRTAAIELRNVLRDEPDNLEARLLFGQTALMLGDLETAEHELTRAREMGASPEQYAFALAYVLAQVGRPGEAMEELERVPEEARDAEWFSAAGEVHAARGRLAEAEEALSRALALEPRSYRAMLGMSRLMALHQDWTTAQQWTERAIDLQPELAEGYVLRANVRVQSGGAAAAERDLARAAELFADGPLTAQEINTLFLLARLQLMLNRADELEVTAQRARSRAPDSALAGYASGAAHYAAGRHDEAQAELQRAAAQAPDDPNLALLLGANHLARGNLGQAEQQVQRVLTARPADAAAARLLAEVRRRQGRPQAALEGLRNARGADEEPSLLALRGILHLDLDDHDQAIALLERALQSTPGDFGTLLQLARAYLAADRPQDATALFADLEGLVGVSAAEAVELAVRLLTQAAADDEDLDTVRARAAQLLDEQPADVQRLTGVALFRHAVGDRAVGRELLERAAELDPNFAPARLLLATFTAAAGETERARVLYAAVTERWPDDYRAWLALARIAAAEQALDEAHELAARAARADPAVLEPHLLLGQLALGQNDLEGASQALAAAERVEPENPDVQTLAGVLAMARQSPDAVEHFQRAAESQPRRAERWYNLARAQRAAGDLDGARTSFERAVALAPAAGAVRFELAQLEIAAGNLEAARSLARALRDDFPDAPQGYLLEAASFAAAGEYERAAPLFDAAYARGPSREAAVGSAESRRQGGLPDAAAPLRRWLEASPDDTATWLVLAQFHQADGRDAEALEAYERVLASQPDNILALNNAAWLYNEAGDARALDYARRAHERAPEAAAVLDTYGWTLVRQGRPAEAVPHLRQAAERAPQSRDIQYHLAYALVQVGERASARELLESLLETPAENFAYREQAETLLAEL